MTRKIAVVTTFSKSGFEKYARLMITTWLKHWPKEVDLWVYPDEPVDLPAANNLVTVGKPVRELQFFKMYGAADPAIRGLGDGRYNYRFDAVKFAHKPFALWDFMHKYGDNYTGLVWLDADTVTHEPVTWEVLNQIAPPGYDIQFLGRCYKYTEMGYCYFNLNSENARALLDTWVGYYTERTFRQEAEWHDSFLFDRARAKTPGLIENDLTGHIPRKQGAGHPFVNSFLGGYMDHYKGDSRKATKSPRKGDLFADHDTPYWRKNPHAKARFKEPR